MKWLRYLTFHVKKAPFLSFNITLALWSAVSIFSTCSKCESASFEKKIISSGYTRYFCHWYTAKEISKALWNVSGPLVIPNYILLKIYMYLHGTRTRSCPCLTSWGLFSYISSYNITCPYTSNPPEYLFIHPSWEAGKNLSRLFCWAVYNRHRTCKYHLFLSLVRLVNPTAW